MMRMLAALVVVVAVSVSGCIVKTDEQAAGSRNSDGTPKSLPPGPPDLPGRTLTLDYGDFGPQAAAFELLDLACYRWAESCSNFEQGDEHDIRVVVYRDLPAAEVARRFPTVPDRSDYRLVSQADALAYLDRHIDELETDMDIPTMLATLRQTRTRITAALGH